MGVQDGIDRRAQYPDRGAGQQPDGKDGHCAFADEIVGGGAVTATQDFGQVTK
jgi:hypothetical protein